MQHAWRFPAIVSFFLSAYISLTGILSRFKILFYGTEKDPISETSLKKGKILLSSKELFN